MQAHPFRSTRIPGILIAVALVVGCSDSSDMYTAVDPAPATEAAKTGGSTGSASTANPFATPNSDTAAQPEKNTAGDANTVPAKVESDGDDPTREALADTKQDQTRIAPIKMEVTVAGGEVSWTPQTEMSYERLDVVVGAADGRHIRKSFGYGEPITVSDPLPDGSYVWETRASPYVAPEVRKEMRAVREAGDVAAEQQLLARLREQGLLPTEEQINRNTQAGHFSIKDGEIVRTDIQEPRG